MLKLKEMKYLKLIPIIIISLLLNKVINNIEILGVLLTKIFSLVGYLVWGFCIAYLLNPMMLTVEKKLRTKRVVSILIIYAVFFSFITVFCILVIPSIIQSIGDLVSSLPNFVEKTNVYITANILNNKIFIKYGVNSYITNNLNYIVEKLNSLLKISMNVAFSQVVNFSSTLFNLITGIVISIYLLIDKEIAISNIKKFLHAFLSEAHTNNIIETGEKVNLIFKEYVVGKSIVSLLIAILCFIALQAMSVNYAILISLIIGISNLIPYFGTIIGLIPTIIITLFSSPISTLKLVIVVLVLSLLDGWYLAPKIIGKKIGLSPIWIIVAITIGGGIYGLVGMFLGVPIAAIIKTFLEEYINRKSESKINLEKNRHTLV